MSRKKIVIQGMFVSLVWLFSIFPFPKEEVEKDV